MINGNNDVAWRRYMRALAEPQCGSIEEGTWGENPRASQAVAVILAAAPLAWAVILWWWVGR